MEFLFKIEDEQQFNRMASAIAREAAKEAALKMLEELGIISSEMLVTECYYVTSRAHVENAIRKGELKVRFDGKYTKVNRAKFREWQKKDSYVIEKRLLSKIAKMKIDALKKENERLVTDALLKKHNLVTESRLLKRDDRLKKIALKKEIERVKADAKLKIDKNRRKIADLKTEDHKKLDSILKDDLL